MMIMTMQRSRLPTAWQTLSVLILTTFLASLSKADTIKEKEGMDFARWQSPQGTQTLQGVTAHALNCFALDLAYAEQARKFTAEDLHPQLDVLDQQRRAQWQMALDRLATGYSPEEWRQGAQTLKENWQEAAHTAALMSVIDMDGDIPPEVVDVMQKFRDCDRLLRELNGEL